MLETHLSCKLNRKETQVCTEVTLVMHLTAELGTPHLSNLTEVKHLLEHSGTELTLAAVQCLFAINYDEIFLPAINLWPLQAS